MIFYHIMLQNDNWSSVGFLQFWLAITILHNISFISNLLIKCNQAATTV